MFKYSERPKTLAERRFEDDVPDAVKGARLNEIIELQLQHSRLSNEKQIGNTVKVLVEGFSKRSEEHLCGRNGQNAMVVFPKQNYEKGQYVMVKISDCTSATLMGEAISLCD
jgi:tRNA-2-methylthio-N6-dimethylallyladenosine synthase